MKQATMSKQQLCVTFTYDPKTVDWARTLIGRKWNPDRKAWTADLSKRNVESCVSNGFTLSAELSNWYEASKRPPEADKPLNIPGLKGKPFPFQERGISYIEKHDGRCLIADEMGLGKTMQALGWLQLRSDALPAVVVCPASVKLAWERECLHWTTLKPFVINAGAQVIPCDAQVYIINYDILARYTEWFKGRGIKTVIVDEAHFIKSRAARRSKAVSALAKECPHVIMLTGTPVINRPMEMFLPISLIDKNLFTSWFKFGERYCDAKHNGYGWDFSGASNTLELHERLTATVMLRRTKTEVLPDLPAKIHSVVPLEGNREMYDAAESNMLAWLRSNDPEKVSGVLRCEALAKVEVLKQLALATKLAQAFEWIDNWLETDGKLVLFTTHRETIKLVMERYGVKAVKVEGGDSQEERQASVDRFQNDTTVRLFVGNIKAAGVGLTLTAASNVAFLELPWSPADLDQAADRVHRIGQTADSVGVHYLLAVGTIDENIFGLLNSKRKTINKIVDGGDVSGEGAMLNELLTELTKKGSEV